MMQLVSAERATALRQTAVHRWSRDSCLILIRLQARFSLVDMTCSLGMQKPRWSMIIFQAA